MSCLNAKGDALESSDTSVILKKRLEWFQDLKFGLFIAFGPYNMWTGGDIPWILNTDPAGTDPHRGDRMSPNWDFDIKVLRNGYWNMNQGFYPRHFDAEQWAQIAKDAGMKYLVFYTKHHDGFNMYDTQLSDYKITSPDCPYSDHPNPDITARLCEAFRKEGFGIGFCHSYADWHSPLYWNPNMPILNRHYNYDINKDPERWQKFVDFLHGQVRELMTGYGKVDILWLDGGWDKKDMQVEKMVEIARSHQPELIVVSRGGNIHQDYKTPERRVPEKPLGEPWETWWTMGDNSGQKSWWVMGDNSTPELIHLLVDIVCKGGNLLLHALVNSDGTIISSCVERLKEMGEWMRVNGEAIYGTRMHTQYRDGNICYTKKGNYVYAIYLDNPQDASKPKGLPALVVIRHVKPAPGTKIHLLGVDEPVKWRLVNDAVEISIPNSVSKSLPCKYAYSFRIQINP
ncbi:MAG: alpha-L-fucosidase [Cyclobacteriaceae bacterium]